MSEDNYDWLASVIAAHNNHEVYGRTRLQKTMKLLQRLGLPTDYRFQIHFYGPYSEELQSDISLLENMGLASEQPRQAQDGSLYYLLHSDPGRFRQDLAPWQDFITRLGNESPVVLELAATYDAFREEGDSHPQALTRLRRKKGEKCGEGREEQALRLLHELGLPSA